MARQLTSTDNARMASSVNLIAGIWLVIAPFVLAYGLGRAVWNDVWVGIAVGILAIIRLSKSAGTSWASWCNAALGVWLIIAPFALDYSELARALANDIILGVVVASMAVWSASGAKAGRPTPTA